MPTNWSKDILFAPIRTFISLYFAWLWRILASFALLGLAIIIT